MEQPARSLRHPIPVAAALRKLGLNLCDARRRRRIPVSIMAERASISRMTLHKAERGDPGVSMGTYATLLYVLGMAGRVSELADPRSDETGLALDEERLPRRIRRRRRGEAGRPRKSEAG